MFSGRCTGCGHDWHMPPVSEPMAVEKALQAMEYAFCPRCGNDGSLAPVNWRFTFDYTQDNAA